MFLSGGLGTSMILMWVGRGGGGRGDTGRGERGFGNSVHGGTVTSFINLFSYLLVISDGYWASVGRGQWYAGGAVKGVGW